MLVALCASAAATLITNATRLIPHPALLTAPLLLIPRLIGLSTYFCIAETVQQWSRASFGHSTRRLIPSATRNDRETSSPDWL